MSDDTAYRLFNLVIVVCLAMVIGALIAAMIG